MELVKNDPGLEGTHDHGTTDDQPAAGSEEIGNIRPGIRKGNMILIQ